MNTLNESRRGNAWFGLFANFESRRVVLPLKGVECEFSVRGGVAEVCLSQIFRQENPKPLDCEYLFPLPADASVYFCEADINGRIIRAEIKELEAARKIVAEKKAGGFRTALVESVRDNLFTLGLGNVQPDDLIVIRLKYFQTLRTVNELRSIEIPFCPGIRYIPGKGLLRSNRGKGIVDDTDQVPDASRISPVRIDAWHPDAAFVDVRGHLDAKYTSQPSVISPSHAIQVKASTEELCVTLSDKSEVPSHDFVLRWSESHAETVAPRAWTRKKGKEVYALLEVRAPKDTAVKQTSIDFYFLVDRSGSMAGVKWSKALEALQSCVGVLGPDDRAMITFFETSFQDYAEQPLPVNKLIGDETFQNLPQRLGANGGTNLEPALRHVLEIAEQKSADRTRNLILITDAQIGNDVAILNLMKSVQDMPVHCFGIDIALNDALLLALSRQQGGTFHSLNPNDDIRGIVTSLGKTLRQPVLLDLQLSAGWESADAKIPNLYAGQFLYLSARASGKKPLSLTAKTCSGDSVNFKFQPQLLAGEAPHLRWCKSRIQRLLAEGNDCEACTLSVASNLLCRLTAFVAWDESEKVAVSHHELTQPNMQPQAMRGAMAGAASGRVMAHFSRLSDIAGFQNDHSQSQISYFMARPQAFEQQSEAPVTGQAVPVTFHASKRPSEELMAAGQRLGGDEWRPLCQMIVAWFTQASDEKIGSRNEALARLIVKLNLCSGLQGALRNAGSNGDFEWVKHLRIFQLELRKLQHSRAPAGEDVANLLGHTKTVDASASAEQLASLAQEIHRQAIEMLKAFAENLLLQK